MIIRSRRARDVLRFSIPLAVIPALTASGAVFFGHKRYLIISLGAALLSLLLFSASFETRRASSGTAAAAAVMTALAVTGRLVPVFKPVAAVIILSGVWLGPETGFLVGSLTALISNVFFGQGPWTPFQMLAWGLSGLVAGYLSKPLKKSRPALLIYGAAAGAAYSLFMDVFTVLWYTDGIEPAAYLAAVTAALPFTAVYTLSNTVFLLIAGKPVGRRLARLKSRIDPPQVSSQTVI